jgi:hypothetical protein
MKSILRSPVKQVSAKYLKGQLTHEVSKVIYLLRDSVDLYFNCMAIPKYQDVLSFLVTDNQELYTFLDVLKRDPDELIAQLRNISSVCSSSDYRFIHGTYREILQLLNSPVGVTDEHLYLLAAYYYLLNRTSVKPFTKYSDVPGFGNSFVFSPVHATEISKASKLMSKTIVVLSDDVIEFADDYLSTTANTSDTIVVADGLSFSRELMSYITGLKKLAKQVYVVLQLRPITFDYISRLGISILSIAEVRDNKNSYPKALIRLSK